VLEEIGAGHLPRLLVFNKIDRVGDLAAQAAATQALLARWPDAVVMSALDGEDVRHLHARLVAFFARDLEESEVRLPYHRQRLRGTIFAVCEVLEERYDDDGSVVFRVRAPRAALARLHESTRA
jgi:GTP-binding protein HflX